MVTVSGFLGSFYASYTVYLKDPQREEQLFPG